jgi:hypothetical protein
MSPYSAPIEVVQAALHRIGEDEIASMDSDESTARVARSNYEGIVAAYFARHAWTFAKRTLPLTYQGEVELGMWKHAFVWPAETVNIRSVMRSGANDGRWAGYRLRSGDYAIEGDRVLTLTDDPLQIVATIRAPEGDWSPDFAEAVVTRMQALFLEALCDKPQDARIKERDAEAKILNAITRDKRQEPGASIEFVPLAEAYRGQRVSRVALRG